MNPSETRHRSTWKYPANLKNMEQACSEVAQILEKCPLEQKDRFAIELLFREALNNAVLHGCHQNPFLSFSGSLTLSDQEAIIEILDDGPGFNWCEELEISHDEAGETGRGLQIYKIYASSIKFNNAGNCVTLTRIFDAQHHDQGENDD